MALELGYLEIKDVVFGQDMTRRYDANYRLGNLKRSARKGVEFRWSDSAQRARKFSSYVVKDEEGTGGFDEFETKNWIVSAVLFVNSG